MKRIAVIALGLFIATIFQQALPDRMMIFGARPDFILIVTVSISVLVPLPAGIWTGFFAGLLQGATAGANLAQYIFSRILTGYATARTADLEIEIGSTLGAVIVGLGTVFAQFIMMFLAPPRSVMAYLGDTLGTAIYNAVLAVPLFALFRALLREPRT